MYQINCPDFVYIGETGRTVKQWFTEHHGDTTPKDETKNMR